MNLMRWMLIIGLALGTGLGCKKEKSDTAATPAPATTAAEMPEAAKAAETPPPDEAAPEVAPPDEGSATPGATAATPVDPGKKNSEKDIVAIGSAGKTKVMPMSSKVVAETGEYQIKLTAPARLASGAHSSATIEIVPKQGWKLNHEFPTKLAVSAPGDIKLKKSEQTVKDAVTFADKSGKWAFEFTVGAAGAKGFVCKMKFAVCTDTTCDPKKEDLAWNVSVE